MTRKAWTDLLENASKVQPVVGTKLSKYRNVKTEVNGIVFDSKKEARRYQDLLYLQRAGKITNLELQPVFRAMVEGVKICDYRADFRYTDVESGKSVTEDVKSIATKTPVFNLKKRLIEALYKIEIQLL